MLGIDAKDAYHALALDDFALVANFFYAGPNFHRQIVLVIRLDRLNQVHRQTMRFHEKTQAKIIPIESLQFQALDDFPCLQAD